MNKFERDRLMGSLPNEARAAVTNAVQQRLVALDLLSFQLEDGELTQEQHANARKLLDDTGAHE